jgi:hypothetical protein
MDLMDITNDSFKRKRKLDDFLDELGDMELVDNSDAGTVQSHQNDTPLLELIIHHQFPGIELVSPLYYSDGATYYILPNQRVDGGFTMRTYLMIDLSRSEFTCALMYRLKRKNTDAFNEATCTQLVMIWNINKFKGSHLVPRLIEHDKDQVWDVDRLMELAKCYESSDMQHDSIEETWLMHDNTVLMISLNVTRGAWHKLEMTISETSIKDDTQRPLYIDMDRWVLMTMMLVTTSITHTNIILSVLFLFQQ